MEIPKVVTATIAPRDQKIEKKEKNNKQSVFLKAILTLCLIFVLPLLMILVNSSGSQDIRSKAERKVVPTAGKILFVPFSFSHDEEDDVLIEFKKKPEIRNGYIPANQLSGRGDFSAILLDSKGAQIFTSKFSPPDLVAVDGFDVVEGKEHAELKKVTANDNGFVLPYLSNATYLRIKNNRGDTVANISLLASPSINNLVRLEEIDTESLRDKIESIKNENNKLLFKESQDRLEKKQKNNDTKKTSEDINKKTQNESNTTQKGKSKGFKKLLNLQLFLKEVLAANGSFNIAIIGDNYGGNTTQFQTDVNDIVAGLLSIEPFSSNKANISFYPQLSTLAICTPIAGWPSISCDDTLTLQQASNIPYDKIYVLYNGPYTGYAYVGGVIAYGSSSTDRGLKVKQGLFVHELAGHALGGLMDEYSYGATGASYAPNCETASPCSSWATFGGLGCFATCGYTNLYRATENNSVMNTAFFNGVLSFDAYATQIVQNQLLSYFSAVSPNPTSLQLPTSVLNTEIPTPIPSFTPMPVSSSPTPSIFLSSTPIPSVAPTSIPAVTSAIVPSATIQPGVTVQPTLTTAAYIATYDILPTATIVPPQVLPTLTSTQVAHDELSLSSLPTVFPTITREPLATISPSPTSVPTPTNTQEISACIFPNYCTAAKYCGEEKRLSISCGRSDRVCCQPVDEPIREKEEENPSKNVFTPLPTLPITPTPSNIGTLQPPEFLFRVTPTNIAVVNPQNAVISPTVFVPRTVPNIITITPSYIRSITETPKTVVYPTEIPPPTPVFVSPTPFNPETFEFERATPTPTIPPSFFGTFGSFLSNIFRSWFSGLFR